MDSYLIAINPESAVSQDPPKVVGVVTAHIHKVKLTIKMEGLVSFTGSAFVEQPIYSSSIIRGVPDSMLSPSREYAATSRTHR